MLKAEWTPEMKQQLRSEVKGALAQAETYAISVQRTDGLWVGEVELNPGPTSQVVMLFHALKRPFPAALAPKARAYILRTQKSDGGWSGFEPSPSDVAVSCECYVALRLLGETADSRVCKNARAAIARLGGVACTNPWTQLYLGILGIIPWELIHKIPIEALLIPSFFGLDVDRFAYWVKVISTPMMLVGAVGPGEPIKEAQEIRTELEIDGLTKLSTAAKPSMLSVFVDQVSQLVSRFSPPGLHSKAVQIALKKIEAFTEANGDFGGNSCTAINVLLALDRMGKAHEPWFEKGLQTLMTYGIETRDEWRAQTCQSHIWDTAFMLSGLRSGSQAINKAAHALAERQILNVAGGWNKNVRAEPGGWCFGNHHDLFPVTDCTAVSLLALSRHLPGFKSSPKAARAVKWLIGMQHSSGGWSAYEKYGGGDWIDRFLTFKDIPNALKDLPKADVSAKVVEALAEHVLEFPELRAVLNQARKFLLSARSEDLLWKGNYGVNYIYGTAFACRALRALEGPLPSGNDEEWAGPARDFFLAHQNPDGGWGETDQSYSRPELKGQGQSSVVQTAWALIGLCAAGPDKRVAAAVRNGARYLLANRLKSGVWEEHKYLGTVFPEKVYFRYQYYPVYFPLMALRECYELFRGEKIAIPGDEL